MLRLDARDCKRILRGAFFGEIHGGYLRIGKRMRERPGDPVQGLEALKVGLSEPWTP
jgi:hypothetical protein